VGAEDDLRRERGQAPPIRDVLVKAAKAAFLSVHALRTENSPTANEARAKLIAELRTRGWHDSSIRLHVLDPKWVPILPRKARGKVSKSGEYRVAIPPRPANKPAPARPAPRPYQSAPAAIVAPPGTGDGVPYVRTMGPSRSYDMREKLVTLPYFGAEPTVEPIGTAPAKPIRILDLEWIESDENEKTSEGALTPTREPASTGPASSLAGGGSAEPAILTPVPPMLEPAIVPEAPVGWAWLGGGGPGAPIIGMVAHVPPMPGVTLLPDSELAEVLGRQQSVLPSVAVYRLSGPASTPNCTGPGQGIEGAACKSLGLFRDSLDRPMCASCLSGAGLATERASRRAAGDALRSWASTYARHRECPELMGAFEASEELGGYAPGGRKAAE
jgi:hypothetical protein